MDDDINMSGCDTVSCNMSRCDTVSWEGSQRAGHA